MLPIRKTNRLIGHDYSLQGGYFITICTEIKFHYFGKIQNGKMHLNNIGNIAKSIGKKIEEVYKPHTELDEFIVMPNHIHGIIFLDGKGPSISNIVKGYKQIVSREACAINEQFARQKSFHDHIIRNDQEFSKIKYYIQENPSQRLEDRFYSE